MSATMSDRLPERLRLVLTPKTSLQAVKVAIAIENPERPGNMVNVGKLHLSRAQLRRLEQCLTVGAQLANVRLSVAPVPEPRRPSPKKDRAPSPPREAKPTPTANDRERERWSSFFGRELEPDAPLT